METHYENMLETLYKMMNDVNRYCPTESITYFLQVFDKLDVTKVLHKLINNMMQMREHMEDLDKYMESNDVCLLPELNMSQVWSKLSSSQKTKIQLYLKMLIIESEIIKNEPAKKRDLKDLSSELGFNPFDGIQPGKNSLELTDISKCLEQFENTADNGDVMAKVKSMMNTFGIDKMINIEGILKDFDETNVYESLSSIKSFMKDTMNDETAELMDDIVKTTLTEMKSKNVKNAADVIDVCSTLKDKIESKNYSFDKLMEGTEKMLDKMKTNPDINKIPEAKSMLDLCSKLLGNPNGGNNVDIDDAYKQIMSSFTGMGMNMNTNIGKQNMSKKR